MKTRLLAASLVMSFGTLAPSTSFAKGNPNSCGPEVSVSVSFDTASAYRITQGIGDPAYLAGFQVGNCSYDFTLNLFNSSPQIKVLLPDRETTAWFFNFDRIGSVPIMDGSFLQATWCTAVNVRNADGSFPYSGTQVLDNYEACGDDVAVDPIKGRYFARRNVGFSLADDYGLRFKVSPWEGQVGGAALGTDFIKVYHPNANTWILEPELDATSVLLDHSKKRAGAAAYQSMPFRAVVTRLAP